MLTCLSCQGSRNLPSAIHEPDSFRRILHHLDVLVQPTIADYVAGRDTLFGKGLAELQAMIAK